MRLLLTMLAAIVLLGMGTARAGSAYEDIPHSHWAYQALDAIVNDDSIDLSIEYPTDFFSREDRQLTRYEFGQAIYFLQNAIVDREASLRILADILSIEFFDQVSSFCSPLSCALGNADYDYSYNPPQWKADLDARLGWEYGVVFAGIESDSHSAYADVPPAHWAYDSLQHFIDNGTLEGYPEGFFNRDRGLTRYEFAQGIACLLDTLSDLENPDPYDVQITEILRNEFSDQLATLSNHLGPLDKRALIESETHP